MINYAQQKLLAVGFTSAIANANTPVPGFNGGVGAAHVQVLRVKHDNQRNSLPPLPPACLIRGLIGPVGDFPNAGLVRAVGATVKSSATLHAVADHFTAAVSALRRQ